MARKARSSERRNFGRRKTLWHAWIKVSGRGREPCVVRNFSTAGALLEFEGGSPTANRFRLMIDAFEFEAACYVRHRSKFGLGVYFDVLVEPAIISKCTPEDIVATMRQQADRSAGSGR